MVFSVSFINKMNTVEFKSATFPNAGSRHLLDDSVMESHSPTRGQAESSTLSSGISLGKYNKTKKKNRVKSNPVEVTHSCLEDL